MESPSAEKPERQSKEEASNLIGCNIEQCLAMFSNNQTIKQETGESGEAREENTTGEAAVRNKSMLSHYPYVWILCRSCAWHHAHKEHSTLTLASAAKELVVGACGGELLRKRIFQNVPENGKKT